MCILQESLLLDLYPMRQEKDFQEIGPGKEEKISTEYLLPPSHF